MDFTQILNFLNDTDRFCKKNNIRLTAISEGHAEAEMDVDDSQMNAANIVQGGAIFTLADLAFAGAANSFEKLRAVSSQSQIIYMRPGVTSKIYATADVIHKGKRSCVVEITVTDANQKYIAKVTTTGFFIELVL